MTDRAETPSPAGIGGVTLTRIETDERSPQTEIVTAIARTPGVEVEDPVLPPSRRSP